MTHKTTISNVQMSYTRNIEQWLSLIQIRQGLRSRNFSVCETYAYWTVHHLDI